jgi:hypothetical protein
MKFLKVALAWLTISCASTVFEANTGAGAEMSWAATKITSGNPVLKRLSLFASIFGPLCFDEEILLSFCLLFSPI